MTHAELRSLALAVLAALLAILLSACESGPSLAHRRLPAFEPPLPKSEFQNVRTTAYTHTEADHREYSDHNALGGQLQAASAPNRRAENSPARALAIRGQEEEQSDYQTVAYTPKAQPFEESGSSKSSSKSAKTEKTAKGKKPADKKTAAKKAKPAKAAPKIGSAAADWGRWPVGTTFRLLSTGQTYRVDDYGWALSGRNTIDLYMATPRDMNAWGTRDERIQILQWGDSGESFRLLQPHSEHPHIKRMILELSGHGDEAAALQ